MAGKFYVEQLTYHYFKEQLVKLTEEEGSKKGYTDKSYHKEHLVDNVSGKGVYDLHVYVFDSEQAADEFIDVVTRG